MSKKYSTAYLAATKHRNVFRNHPQSTPSPATTISSPDTVTTAFSLTYRNIMVLLGVEQMFSFSTSNYIRFRSNRGDSPFRTIDLVDTRTFADIYYDINMTLARNGIWLRTRDGTWLAKKRFRGDLKYPGFAPQSRGVEIMEGLTIS